MKSIESIDEAFIETVDSLDTDFDGIRHLLLFFFFKLA
jgi:hypothetical protein